MNSVCFTPFRKPLLLPSMDSSGYWGFGGQFPMSYKCRAREPLGRQWAHLFPWSSANPLGICVLTRLVRGAFPSFQYLIRQYFPFYSYRSLYKAFSISLCAFVIWLSFPVWGFLLLSLWAFSNCPDSFLFLVDLTCVPVLMPFPSCFNSLHSLCFASEVTFYGFYPFFSLKLF